MDIANILSKRFEGEQWTLEGDDYSGLTWLSETSKPTEKALLALWPEVQYETAYARVEIARQSAYQQTADPIFFEYQRGDATEAEWLAAVQAVKDAHPYPEQV